MNKLFFLICFRLDNPFFSCYNVPMKANCVNILKLIFLFTFGLFTLWGCGKGSEPADVNLMEEVSELPDATITIPSTLVGNEADLLLPVSPETPPADSSEESASYQETDSSQAPMVTYHIDGDTRTELVNEITKELEESVSSVLADKYYYPDITDIQVNEDASEFTIFLSSDQPNLYESTLMLSFYTIGNKYQIYLGVPAEEAVTTVIYKNAETGEELARTDSTSMQ